MGVGYLQMNFYLVYQEYTWFVFTPISRNSHSKVRKCYLEIISKSWQEHNCNEVSYS